MQFSMSSWRPIVSAIVGGTCLLATSLAHCENTIFSELSDAVKAPSAVAKLGPDIFGDQVNLYTGVLSFEQVDLIWNGTGDIPLRLGRRLAVGKESLGNDGRAFRIWGLDVPHLYTTLSGDGTSKQYRGSGQDHGGIPRPNVKETGKNVTPDGKEFTDKGRVRPARPDEIPKG